MAKSRTVFSAHKTKYVLAVTANAFLPVLENLLLTQIVLILTLPKLMPLSVRLKHKDAKIFERPSKLCHVGIHLIALPEYSQMSTHVPESFFCFCIILYYYTSLEDRKP